LAVLAAAVLLLDISLTFESAWPTPGIRWAGALSIELAVFVLALAAAARGNLTPSRRALRWFAGVWVVLVLGHYADVTATALYGRDINLYWDLRFVPDVAALLARPERLWIVGLAAAAAVIGLVLIYQAGYWALGRVGNAMTRRTERRALAAAAAIVVLMFAAGRAGTGVASTLFPAPVTQTYARQARLMVRTLTKATSIPPSPAMNSDLSLARGADVFLIFVEAYGAISFERPDFAARLAADRAALDAAIHDTHREVVSAYVQSPTFGGSSWLAHITLLSGVGVGDHDTNAVLMTEKRDTLVTDFKQHGYRAVAIMPGTWKDWPEGAFYGYDEIYGGERLDYHGPEFGWWDMTDEYVLAKMNALEVDRTPRPPLFVFFPTISTHIPFTPVPPYQPDWSRMLTPNPYDEGELKRAYLQEPDWMNLGPSYANSLSYAYRTFAGYLRLPAPRDYVMILIGDHQPAAAVSGQGASWDVPVHVITSRKPVLDRLVAHGFRRGLTPARPALGPMQALTPMLLDVLGNREAPVARVP
jgi:hypothetical protein